MSTHGKATSVLLAGVDVSNWLNSIAPSETLEAAETSGFQQEEKTYIPGRSDSTVSVGGRFQGSAESVEKIIRDDIEGELSPALTVGWGMGIAKGNPAMFGRALHTSFSVTAPTNDVVSISGDMQYDGGIFDGVHLVTSALIVTDLETATYDNGEVFAGDSIAAVLHLVENTADGTAEIRIEHSTNGTTWVDLVTFATVGAGLTAYEILPIAVSVNRYLRVGVTLAGATGGVRPLVAIGRH